MEAFPERPPHHHSRPGGRRHRGFSVCWNAGVRDASVSGTPVLIVDRQPPTAMSRSAVVDVRRQRCVLARASSIRIVLVVSANRLHPTDLIA